MDPLFKYSWTNNIYMKKIDEEQKRVFFYKEIKSEYS